MRNKKGYTGVELVIVIAVFTVGYFLVANTLSYNFDVDYEEDLYNLKIASIEEQAAKVYPTIFDSRLNVVLPDDAQSVEIIGIAGNSVYKTTTDGQQTLTVDGSQLAPGAYIVRIGTTSKPVMLKAIKR